MEMAPRKSMSERMMGAAKLDSATYEEVEHDRDATMQAAAVVAIVAVCAAIGGARDGTAGILTGLLAAFFGWLLWAGITYLIGDKLLGGTATWGELLRTIGFAQAPGVLYLLGIIPLGIGWLVRLIVGIWILVAVIIAIRQALDFGTGKALLTAFLGWVAYVILGVLLGVIFGINAQVI